MSIDTQMTTNRLHITTHLHVIVDVVEPKHNDSSFNNIEAAAL